MGADFSKSDPTIYKFGKIRKAKTKLRQGDIDTCISTLCDGFDLTQVYMKFRPKEWRIWYDNKKILEEEERIAKEEAIAKKKGLWTKE
jgi:hypothetical protein